MKKLLSLLIPPLFRKHNLFSKFFYRCCFPVYRILKLKSARELFVSVLEERIKTLNIEQNFPTDLMQKHYVFEPMRNNDANPDLMINQIRYQWLLDHFRKNEPELLEEHSSILNVGDTDGHFLEVLGKTGTSVNINPECVEYIEGKGHKALLSNAECIDLPDRSFDYVFCFQTLEHCHNPVKAMDELGRIARKKIFITIPHTEETIIYDLGFWMNLMKSSWEKVDPRVVDAHIFEFSKNDLVKVSTFSELKFVSDYVIDYFSPCSFKGKMLNSVYSSYFHYYEFLPRNIGSHLTEEANIT